MQTLNVRLIALCAAAAVLLVGCKKATDGDGSPGPTPGGPAEILAMEEAVHDLINQERANVGKPALAVDGAMVAVARAHSEDMRDRAFFSHTNPDSLDPFDRMTAAGISYSAAAENIAYNSGYPDPAATVVAQWMGSPGHKSNLLDEPNYGFTLTGVGVAYEASSGTWWFTQIFKKP